MLVLLALGCTTDPGKDDTETTPPDDSDHTGDSTQGPDETGDSVPGDSEPPLTGCAAAENPGPLGPAMCVSAAPCGWVGDQGYEYMGWAVAASDLDGDDRADLLVGSPTYDTEVGGENLTDAGRVQLITGVSLDDEDGGVFLELTGGAYAVQLGSGVTPAGDVNGDGAADLLIGAQGDDVGATNAGVAYLLFGPSSEWESGIIEDQAGASMFGESEYARVGQKMAGQGDVNGDGLADLLLAGELYDGGDDRNTGRAYLVYGRAEGWALDTSLDQADAVFSGTGSLDQAGMGLALAGDFDGDGYADPAVGSPYAGSYYGRASVFQGGADTLQGDSTTEEAGVVLQGEGMLEVFGWALCAGDLDGDGDDELVVGAPLGDRPYPVAGEVYIYEGSSEFFEGPSLLASVQGSWDDQQLGTSLAVGDVDADGRDDLLLGVIGAYAGLQTKSGRVVLWKGRESGWAEDSSLESADASFHGAGVKDYLGTTMALGDANGDGLDDLLLSAAYANIGDAYDQGRLYLFWGE